MNRSLLNISVIIISVLSVVGAFLIEKEDNFILPITTVLIFCLLFLDFYLIRRKVKLEIYHRIGKNKNGIWYSVTFSIFGLIQIVLGILETQSSFSWKGIDYKIFLGIIFIIVSLLRIEYFLILFKEKSTVFNNSFERREWLDSKIEQVIMKDKKLTFIKKSKKIEYECEFENDTFLIDLLSKRYNDRFICNQ